MPFYAQVSSEGKVKQMFYQMDNRSLPELKKENPTDLFVETEYFGDADNFAFVNGKVVQFEKPVDNQLIITQNKLKRNGLLLQSDWTQLPDVDLTTAQKDSWIVYRQALRDMTQDDFLSGNFPVYK